MVDFETELNKLLSGETGGRPWHELDELASADRELLAELNRKQVDASLQIEEIYDLVKEQDFLRETAAAEKARADRLALAAMGLADLLEDFCAYAGRSGSKELEHQAKLLREKAGGVLSDCGITRLGEEGQTLNPQIHRVEAIAESSFPREQVIRVLQSGYRYQNTLIRKAAVVVSRGQEEPAESGQGGRGDSCKEEEQNEGQNSWH